MKSPETSNIYRMFAHNWKHEVLLKCDFPHLPLNSIAIVVFYAKTNLIFYYYYLIYGVAWLLSFTLHARALFKQMHFFVLYIFRYILSLLFFHAISVAMHSNLLMKCFITYAIFFISTRLKNYKLQNILIVFCLLCKIHTF